MNDVLQAALQQAMNHRSTSARVEAVKLAISNFILEGDPAARIHHTEYFNHTFAPDLVLSWPREKRSRFVFLRTNANPRWLADDLKIISSRHPIMLTLERPDQTVPEARDDLLKTANSSQSLVTDPGAIDAIRRSRTATASVFTDAIFRGGRGLLDQDVAAAAASANAAGFSAAETLAPEPVRVAVESAGRHLNGEQAGRITRLLQAIWEGQGGAADDFPGRAQTQATLSDLDLQFLLSTVTIEDPEFWRRLGRGIELDVLVAMGSGQTSANLDRLIATNLDRLLARCARVLGGTESAEGGSVHWDVNRGCLMLATPHWQAYFATKIDNLPEPERRGGVQVADLLSRARQLGWRLTDAKVQQPGFAISIAAVGDSDVGESPDFTGLVTRPSATVHSAALAAPSGRNVVLDFPTGTASGHTSATFGLHELVPAVVGGLLGLEDSDAQGGRPRGQRSISIGPAIQDPLF